MSHALIIGGNGQIGRAVAQMFVQQGWQVTIAGRSTPKNPILSNAIKYVKVDRKRTQDIKGCVPSTVDFLLDCISFDEEDAVQLAELSSSVGRICVVSSASVYTDQLGRTLDEASTCGFPELPVPITTSQSTVQASSKTYSTKKIAIEKYIASNAECPVSILRPCAIYGPYSKHAREWFFVKRLLDERKYIPLAYSAESRFHTTSVDGIAAAVLASANGCLPLITNVVDSNAPTVREIGLAIMKVMGIEAEIVGISGTDFPPETGRSPWAIPNPVVCEPSEDYCPVGVYSDLIAPTVRYLANEIDLKDWKDALPQLAWYPMDLFDYDTEDKVLVDL